MEFPVTLSEYEGTTWVHKQGGGGILCFRWRLRPLVCMCGDRLPDDARALPSPACSDKPDCKFLAKVANRYFGDGWLVHCNWRFGPEGMQRLMQHVDAALMH